MHSGSSRRKDTAAEKRLKNYSKEYEIAIINDPTTPDRTSYILDNNKKNPINSILDMVKKLESFDSDVLVMPCNTASYFYKEIINNTNLLFINIVKETVDYLKKINIKKVGLLATDGTIKSKIYEDLLNNYNIELIIPNKYDQDIISSIIYDGIKSGQDIDLKNFYDVLNDLKKMGCEKIILECTELSVLKELYNLNDKILVDAMEILADNTIKYIKNTN